MYFEKGEKLKIIDFLYGFMFFFGNDAVVVLVIVIVGDVKRFVNFMNKKVKEFGFLNIVFLFLYGLE